jgi:hypothetical protein
MVIEIQAVILPGGETNAVVEIKYGQLRFGCEESFDQVVHAGQLRRSDLAFVNHLGSEGEQREAVSVLQNGFHDDVLLVSRQQPAAEKLCNCRLPLSLI